VSGIAEEHRLREQADRRLTDRRVGEGALCGLQTGATSSNSIRRAKSHTGPLQAEGINDHGLRGPTPQEKPQRGSSPTAAFPDELEIGA
jgi:hypothetical protein